MVDAKFNAIAVTNAALLQLRKIRMVNKIPSGYILHACVDCGKERLIPAGNKKKERFTGLCVHCNILRPRKHPSGEEHYMWKGGRIKDSEGYIRVKLQPDDFFYPMAMTNPRGYVVEHRLVIAKHLNRCLHSWEIVHHKNGVKDDNQIANLELLPHRRFHLVDAQTKARIRQLELQVSRLQAQLKRVTSQTTHKHLRGSEILTHAVSARITDGGYAFNFNRSKIRSEATLENRVQFCANCIDSIGGI